MKLFSASLVSLFAAHSAYAAPGLQMLPGTYRSDEGNQFVVTRQGSSVSMRTNAELSRYGLCRSPLALATTNLDSDDDYAEARFSVPQAACAHMDGPIVLHYNKAITGVDVFLVDVVIRGGHGRDHGQTMRWHLKKVQ